MYAMALDFENEFFERLKEDINGIKTDQSKIHTELEKNTDISQKAYDQAKKTNGRMTQAEKDILALQKAVLKKPIQLPPATSKFWVIMATISLVIVLWLVGQTHLIERFFNAVFPN